VGYYWYGFKGEEMIIKIIKADLSSMEKIDKPRPKMIILGARQWIRLQRELQDNPEDKKLLEGISLIISIKETCFEYVWDQDIKDLSL
jgi:hypothetical protein